jgi:hypothetical protein
VDDDDARVCPHCGQDAPLVYRGVVPYCTACGRIRAPLTNRSVNMAGRPASVGGTVAGVFGWLMLLGGIGVAGLIATILALLHFPILALAVGGPIALLALLLGGGLVMGGKKLRTQGATTQKDTRVEAIFALAQTRKGILLAKDVAHALAMPVEEANALLETLAKTDSDHVSLEVDDDGGLFYRFSNAPWMSEERFRVAVKTRVDAPTGEVIEGELVEPAPKQQRRR